MNRILEIDEENHVAVVEAGVTLSSLIGLLRCMGFVTQFIPVRKVQLFAAMLPQTLAA